MIRFFLKIIIILFIFLAVLIDSSLLCWLFIAVFRLSLVTEERSCSLLEACRLPITVASLVKHRLRAHRLPQLWCPGFGALQHVEPF